jgi:predicted nuclease of predicted toxin-antitoxin system
VIVTKDEDFADMVVADGGAPAVVWIRVGNKRRVALLAWCEQRTEQIVALVDAGDRLIELR